MARPRVLIAVLLPVVLAACAGPRLRERSSSSVGRPLSLTAPDLDGREVDIAARLGRKVTVVDFWATWCEPCKEQMPVLDGMARELEGRGLAVYGVSVDEDRSQLTAFLQERPVAFPILWDKGAARLSQLDVSSMPVTLIVDRRGVIRFVHQGWDPRRAERERDEIEALLAEP